MIIEKITRIYSGKRLTDEEEKRLWRRFDRTFERMDATFKEMDRVFKDLRK